jgi:hypothetical protein
MHAIIRRRFFVITEDKRPWQSRISSRPPQARTSGVHVDCVEGSTQPFRTAISPHCWAKLKSQMACFPLFANMQSTTFSATLGFNPRANLPHMALVSEKLSHCGPGARNVEHPVGGKPLSSHIDESSATAPGVRSAAARTSSSLVLPEVCPGLVDVPAVAVFVAVGVESGSVTTGAATTTAPPEEDDELEPQPAPAILAVRSKNLDLSICMMPAHTRPSTQARCKQNTNRSLL